VGEVAAEFGISTATIYGWKAKMNDGTLRVDDGAQGARHRQLTEKLSLLLESRGLADEELGSWLRENRPNDRNWATEFFKNLPITRLLRRFSGVDDPAG